MRQLPILFSTLMVQAHLEGRKKMTRRINGLDKINECPDDWVYNGRDDGCHYFYNEKRKMTTVIRSPYGIPGDFLWVRETLEQHGELGLTYVADKEWLKEEEIKGWENGPYGGEYSFCKIPSIHMPKWAARIWQEVIFVKVERLHDISQDDAIAEGIEFDYSEGQQFKNYLSGEFEYGDSRDSFESLWISINGRESWISNPWVWVVEYKVLSTTGKPEHLQ
jgi:hypothetical protein